MSRLYPTRPLSAEAGSWSNIRTLRIPTSGYSGQLLAALRRKQQNKPPRLQYSDPQLAHGVQIVAESGWGQGHLAALNSELAGMQLSQQLDQDYQPPAAAGGRRGGGRGGGGAGSGRPPALRMQLRPRAGRSGQPAYEDTAGEELMSGSSEGEQEEEEEEEPQQQMHTAGHGGVVAVGPGAGHLFTALEKLGKCSLHVAVCSGSSSSGSSGSSGSSSSGSSSGAGGLRVAAAAAVCLGTQPGGWMTFSQPKKLASDLAVAAAAGACDELLLLLCQQGGEPCPTLFQFPIAAGTATATLPHIVPRLAQLAAEAAAAAAPVAASLVHAWPGLSLNGFTKKLQLSGELMGFPAVRLRCIGRAHQQAEQLCTQLPCTSSGHAAQRGTAMLPQLQCSSAATAGTAFRFLAATHVVCSLAFCSPRCSSDRGD